MSQEGFSSLSPDDILNATEDAGFMPTGEFKQLNSYENRVFEIALEDSALPQVIVKFYRPKRWTKEAIDDEHYFLHDLKQEGIQVVSPLKLKNNSTILEYHDMYVSFFPKCMGRMPQEFIGDELMQVGRVLARIHNVGSQKKAQHRWQMTPDFYIDRNLELLRQWIAPEVKGRYIKAAQDISAYLKELIEPNNFIRIHGDCHRGNLLHTGDEFFFVDFDDFCNGPVAQDLWMLLSGDVEYEDEELDQILGGYTELREFDEEQLDLFEPLRGMRIIHYAAWIARRWSDPSFPRIFPQFEDYAYWADEVEALERIAWDLSS